MLSLILRRVAQMVAVALAVVALVFFLLRLAGDPARLLNSADASEATIAATRERLGLDDPVIVQFFRFLGQVLRGDLGSSYLGGYDVSSIVFGALPNTIMLAIAIIACSTVLSLVLGISSALAAGSWWDRCVQVYVALAQATPNFWLAVILVLIFAVNLGWFPAVDFTGPVSFVLPVTTMTVVLTPILIRTVRQSFLETLDQDYVRAARARGIAPLRIVGIHVLKVASLPLVTLIGMQLGVVLAGSYVIEVIFNWPGIGKLAVDSLNSRDFPMVQGAVLVAAVTFVLVNSLVDLTYSVLDPRVRAENT
ncbi:ABC transporter permease [Nocardioides sp. L-11A]|uniref:ABC transporter permease n=1 Tax=Nocardioides sp. L-11A TaxID=3043848 RepID=UPI00249B5280|nr:ABC transporter permease [Nocardioides sp. L-11A]